VLLLFALLSGLHSVLFAYAQIIGNHSLHLFIVLGPYHLIYLRVSCVAKLLKKDFDLYNFDNSYFIHLNQKPLCGLFAGFFGWILFVLLVSCQNIVSWLWVFFLASLFDLFLGLY